MTLLLILSIISTQCSLTKGNCNTFLFCCRFLSSTAYIILPQLPLAYLLVFSILHLEHNKRFLFHISSSPTSILYTHTLPTLHPRHITLIFPQFSLFLTALMGFNGAIFRTINCTRDGKAFAECFS